LEAALFSDMGSSNNSVNIHQETSASSIFVTAG
jgi:hypothetical protein